MEFMQVEMFVAVVEEQNIRAAADRVRHTQPAVSMAVHKLENEIGAHLFYKSQREHFLLTKVGESLYSYASRILRLRSETLSISRNSPARPRPQEMSALIFVGGLWAVFGRSRCYRMQTRRSVRVMRILQSPYLQGFTLSC